MEDRGDISVKSLTVSNAIEQRRGRNVDLNDTIKNGRGEDDVIFIIIITFLVVGSLRESVRFAHRSSGYMCDGKVESREIQGPSSLSVGQLLSFLKDLEILVVGQDFDIMRGTLKVVTPFFKSFDDGQKFTIVYVIILLSFNERFRHECYWVPEAIVTFLRQYCSAGLF